MVKPTDNPVGGGEELEAVALDWLETVQQQHIEDPADGRHAGVLNLVIATAARQFDLEGSRIADAARLNRGGAQSG